MQSVKIVTANVRQIRKVTTTCQVSLDSIKAMFLISLICFFFHGDIELQRVRSDKNSLL